MEFARPPQNQKAIAEIHAPVFHDWEHALLEKARAGFVERIAATREHLIRSTHLVKAYAHCGGSTHVPVWTWHPADLSCDARCKWMPHMFRISAFRREGIPLKGVGKGY